MPRMGKLRRLAGQHRRLVMLLGVLVVLAISAAGIHAAICGCDDEQCLACAIVAGTVVATAAGTGWRRVRPMPKWPYRVALAPAFPECQAFLSLPLVDARAGPSGLAVFRL
jgi:hypothetical protein